MAPFGKPFRQDDDTVDSSTSDPLPKEDPLPKKSSSSSFAMKRKNRLTAISRKYDLDGDGVLDEAEQAMRDRDVANRGFLTNDEIYDIVQEQLRAKRSAGYMKRLIGGLICFVVLLAMSNLGTSLAAAFLAKDLKADDGSASTSTSNSNTNGSDEAEEKQVPAMRISKTGEIAAAQTVADAYVADPMTDEQLSERRRLVLEEVDGDPHSHAHRRDLKACRASRARDSGCNNHLSFDSRVMRQSDLEVMMDKCQKNQVVYMQREYGDGSERKKRSDCVCERGSTVVVKEKRSRKKKGGNKDKDKKKGKKGREKRDREIIIEREDGRVLHADCVNDLCYCGGTTLQGNLDDPCLLNGDECRRGLVCERTTTKTTKRNGVRVSSTSSSRYGTCVRPTRESSVVVVRQAGGLYCNVRDGRDACERGFYCALDTDVEYEVESFELAVRSGRRGGGGGHNYGDCSRDRDSCARGYACTQNSRRNDEWSCKPVNDLGSYSSTTVRSTSSLSVSNGIGTCVRTVGRGQTCYSDYMCGDGYVCDYMSPGRFTDYSVSPGGDCTHSRRCARGAACLKSPLNGSDRYNCEYDDDYWRSDIVGAGGICVDADVVYRTVRSGGGEGKVGGCKLGANWDCSDCRTGCPSHQTCRWSGINGSDRWNCEDD